MGAPAQQLRSLNFEGEDISKLRVAVPAVNTTCKKPLRRGDRVRIVIDCEVDSVAHYGSPLTRRHGLKVIQVETA